MRQLDGIALSWCPVDRDAEKLLRRRVCVTTANLLTHLWLQQE